MRKGGLADSPFFARPGSAAPAPTEAPAASRPKLEQEPLTEKKEPVVKLRQPKDADTVTPRHHDTTVSSNRATMPSRNHEATVETVRKAVKEIGKEAATHRFTAEEKKAVLDVIYAYQGQGIKTSENEITRLALNFILEDYKQNGRSSILDQVLRALNS